MKKRIFSSIIIFLFLFSPLTIFPLFFTNQDLRTGIKTKEENEKQALADLYYPSKIQSSKKLIRTSMEIEISSYLGGSGSDEINFMEIDSNNDVYLAGYTDSWDFPLENSLKDFVSGGAGFLTKIDSDGNILFSTLIDGSGNDFITYMALDNEENIYLVGTTDSYDFPLVNAYDDTFDGENDIFLMKISPSGEIIYSTYIGGTGSETANPADFRVEREEIVFDSQNSLYIGGWTQSADFPMINAIDDTLNGSSDGFVSKFSPTGDLLFSTYIGGESHDGINFLEIDNQDNIYLGGETNSTNLSTINALDSSYNGEMDIFLSKIDSTGNLIFNTYFGGSGNDSLRQFFINNQGNLLLSGWTESTDFPVQYALYETFSGEKDLFVTEIDLSSNLIKSTYIGSSSTESVTEIIEDEDNNLYLSGVTRSWEDFPHTKFFNITSLSSRAGYLIKLNSTGHLIFSLIIGGESIDILLQSTLDFQNDIYLLFFTFSENLPMKNPLDPKYSGEVDTFLVKISSIGELLFSTYLGGVNRDSPSQLKYNGNLFLTGWTSSPDFFVKNAFDNYNGEMNGPVSEGFFVKLLPDTDNDGMHDSWELKYGLNPIIDDTQDDKDNDEMPNFWEYEMGLDPSYNDANEDKDGDTLINLLEFDFGSSATEPDTDNDQMDDFYEFITKLNPTENDAQDDKDFDGLTNIIEYNFGSYANKIDSDNDGIHDYYEYLHHLNPLFDDSKDDADDDKLLNIQEFLLATNATNNDTDGDKMDDFFEVQMDLDPLNNDADADKDGDWVSNYLEYREKTNISDIFSVPLFFSEFPFLCFSLIHCTFFSVIGISAILGLLGAFFYQYQQKRLLMHKLGAPNYETALLMVKGGFTDLEMFIKAQSLNISAKEEYIFMLEMENQMNEEKLPDPGERKGEDKKNSK